MKYAVAVIIILSLFLQNCQVNKVTVDPIVGIKLYELQSDYNQLINEWKAIGINASYVSIALAYDNKFRDLAKENNIDVYVIIPIFYNPEVLSDRPEWYGIKEDGGITKEEWVEFINPANLDYRAQRIQYIQKVVEDTKPTGISIDFIRYFSFWEKIYANRTLETISNSSFDSLSLSIFQKKNNIVIPNNLTEVTKQSKWILENHKAAWTKWKCDNINTMVEQIVTVAKRSQPDLLTNLHVVPWRENDFNGAGQHILGQDLGRLAGLVDYISPMCYSHMLKRDAPWVGAVISDFSRQTNGASILPSIQVKEAYLTNKLSPSEFKNNLMAALLPPSKGVIFWSWPHFQIDKDKKMIVKKVVID
ncbi:MAG: hypothetical protein V3V00_13250 [Saprospiraceae bacterium]